jgi:ketosteroid isomerase-like protein
MTSAAEIEIRLRRAAFNRALADADLAAISPLLAPDVMLVAGTDSAVITGRKAQLATWKREFASADRSIYIRTPATITISPALPLAFEQGEWRAVESIGGPEVASGLYTAKWRRFDSLWLIEAELFLTMS